LLELGDHPIAVCNVDHAPKDKAVRGLIGAPQLP
jgi:hypothetical protein